MTWLTSHLSAILGVSTLVSEILGFTPVGGIVKGIAGAVAAIAQALSGNKS